MMSEYLSSDLIKIPNLLIEKKKDEGVLFKVLGAHNEDVTQLKISQNWKGGKSLVKKLPNLKIISSLKTDQYFRFGHNGVLFELSSNRKTPLIVSHLFFYPLEKSMDSFEKFKTCNIVGQRLLVFPYSVLKVPQIWPQVTQKSKQDSLEQWAHLRTTGTLVTTWISS